MLRPVRTVEPAEMPVTLVDAKAHCVVDHSDDDVLIEGFVRAATDHLDGWRGVLGVCLVTQTWRFDCAGFPRDGCIRLPVGPVQSIAGITYRDSDDIEQTLATSVYHDPHNDPLGGFVVLKSGQSWPATFDRPAAVSITFVAGFGSANKVPVNIKLAINLMVGHWYENREASVIGETIAELPLAVDALLAPFRRVGV